jgi:hypothetical protein
LGTIDTGLPGSTAAASITGPAGNQTLSLTIPQGPTGPQGATGDTGPAGSIGTVTLDDLNDVVITGTIADNEVLSYDTTSSQWINQTAAEAGLAESSHTHAIATDISGLGTGVATFLATPSSSNLATAVSDETGSGALVFATSPSLTTPSLGVATATSINGTSIPTSKTLVATDYTVTAGTTATAATGIGYMGIPSSSGATTGAYTLAIGDAGEHVYTTATRTVTIPGNTTGTGPVAFPVGTTIAFVNDAGATLTLQMQATATDTCILAGAGTSMTGGTGSRTLAAHGVATLVKVTSTRWYISGNGLS